MYHYKEEPKHATRCCDSPGCGEPGEHRAPKDRSENPEYFWFCLEHVREYNKQWNYFDGMSREEIERFQTEAAYGHRPTWNHQTRPVEHEKTLHQRLHEYRYGSAAPNRPTAAAAAEYLPPIKPTHKRALRQLELEHPTEQQAIKAQYKKLFKQYHPDVNPGDKDSEERFKHISESYRILIAEYVVSD